MDPTKCAQHYQPADVKAILTASEGGAAAPAVTTQKVHAPLYGDFEVPVWSDDKTGGHAQERHLLITEGQLKERTLPGDDPEASPGLPMATAFLSDKLADLCKVTQALLNCEKGREGLSWLDSYREFGKTRICIVESLANLGLPAIDVRVFYQGRMKSSVEKAQQAAIVVDSNLGGKHPIKIVTCFPCKDEPRLELKLGSVMAECRNVRSNGGASALEGTAGVMAKTLNAWVSKQPTSVPDVLLQDQRYILVGRRFNSGWVTPNAELFKFKYDQKGTPIKDVDDPYNKKAYERLPAGKAPATLVSLVMLQAAAEQLEIRLSCSVNDVKNIVARVR